MTKTRLLLYLAIGTFWIKLRTIPGIGGGVNQTPYSPIVPIGMLCALAVILAARKPFRWQVIGALSIGFVLGFFGTGINVNLTLFRDPDPKTGGIQDSGSGTGFSVTFSLRDPRTYYSSPYRMTLSGPSTVDQVKVLNMCKGIADRCIRALQDGDATKAAKNLRIPPLTRREMKKFPNLVQGLQQNLDKFGRPSGFHYLGSEFPEGERPIVVFKLIFDRPTPVGFILFRCEDKPMPAVYNLDLVWTGYVFDVKPGRSSESTSQ